MASPAGRAANFTFQWDARPYCGVGIDSNCAHLHYCRTCIFPKLCKLKKSKTQNDEIVIWLVCQTYYLIGRIQYKIYPFKV